jgi:hypothetical protein
MVKKRLPPLRLGVYIGVLAYGNQHIYRGIKKNEDKEFSPSFPSLFPN